MTGRVDDFARRPPSPCSSGIAHRVGARDAAGRRRAENTPAHVSRDLTTTESLRLLAGVRFGRIVYSRYALPTIRPVNHLVDGETIIVHAERAAGLAPERQVVAYEADTLDEDTRRGWCVIVTGTSDRVTDPAEIDRYRGQLCAWLPGPRDHFVRIEPDIITGIEFVDPDDPRLA
ncbi:pyridoxamine 5'-phosphate oxidase family protein [Nocardia terpenica]|uniref:Pyridoxamine 5'-phosphate oxidase family protein n=1 Tax=Nocardia terpenica TaxID=455432 RepID=A0A291RGU0_9NOCA|nr:pyridoxamine 5'-phosphate oxidase family protein [Nocardia terpenica]MBF6065891.1 pyridoxamine 5'-phosphate oxidase family protein [Nocardia terpenica]MBF6108346.1 pyridoxamine 5'-phosphate oxidase family protein [Nocardia terpenica]MBF6116006.1 pyridoxamine 5'-phosphate oxidase family protein [Nocardia terpenica]MBF6123136.1 pyridoxamine 5'-phosphate oxidase family protein [Nocardia terpenica]